MDRRDLEAAVHERLYVDASVLIAIMIEEADWRDLAERLKRADLRFTGAVSILEAIIRLSSVRRLDPQVARQEVEGFLRRANIEVAMIGARTAAIAAEAHARFGKGRHPARLNLGDCFSYACAKEAGLTLLYKGDDFARTDLG